MKHSLQNIRRLTKRVNANRLAGKQDWYDGLDFEQVECLYKFARSGYLTCSAKNFGYIDVQSDCKYIRVLLLKRFLEMLSDRDGIQIARDEYSRLQCCGWMYGARLQGELVLCTSEGQTRVDLLNKGIMPEGSRGLFELPQKRAPFDMEATRVKTVVDLPIYAPDLYEELV